MEVAPLRASSQRAERSSRTSASAESNILLDAEILDDVLMSLVLTVMVRVTSINGA